MGAIEHLPGQIDLEDYLKEHPSRDDKYQEMLIHIDDSISKLVLMRRILVSMQTGTEK